MVDQQMSKTIVANLDRPVMLNKQLIKRNIPVKYVFLVLNRQCFNHLPENPDDGLLLQRLLLVLHDFHLLEEVTPFAHFLN